MNAASRLVASYYNLGSGNPDSVQIAQKLETEDKYIYPWDGRVWDRQRPYRSSLLSSILRAWLYDGDFALARSPEFHKEIQQISRDPSQPEMPDTLVALAAAVTFAAIHEWSSGSHQPLDFRSSVFTEKYNQHALFLGARRACWWEYHAMLAGIYSEATPVTHFPISTNRR